MARRKTQVRPAARRTKRPVARGRAAAERLDPEDVAFLFDRLQAEERSERLWKEMTAPVAEGDPWAGVEDALLARATSREDHLRRWKFFGK